MSTPPTPAPTTDKPPRPRRWIPLSLRIFMATLVLVGAGSVLCIGVPAYRQHRAIQELKRLDGLYCHFYTDKVGPDWLRKCIGDKRMAFFDPMTSIRLDGPQLTDAEMSRLKDLPHLTLLWLDTTCVTDEGLVHLRSLPGLKVLHLDNMPLMTDAALGHVQGLKHLEILSLERSFITDAGIEHLKCLTNLQEIDISATKVTVAGAAELERALPGARISSGDGGMF